MKHLRPLPAPVETADSTGRYVRCDVTGKARFTSRGQAAKTRGKRRNKGHRMRAYLCEHCHGWHLTSSAHDGGARYR